MGLNVLGKKVHPFALRLATTTNSSIDFTIRIPGEGFREPTPGSILTKYEDEEGGVMGTFAFIHNLHCLVSPH